MTAAPDVSVIVAVYNTMPYLTGCLTSLVEQTIGLSRLEIIAVDDGSTDGGGAELDRFAHRHPGTVKVLHQPNSGGPAAPSNRALDLATGRFVHFVGADDRLGPEALERLVRAADEYDSDIVIGKMVGAGGRNVYQALYRSTEREVTLTDSALPWTLSNCKLFRRDLIERHGLRFPEDMPIASDQPFTLAACVRARRISVLADYAYYYATRRADAGNITYAGGRYEHLDAAERLLEFTAGLLEPGPARDAVTARHLTWEVGRPLRDDFPDLDPADQEKLCARVGELADRFLTDAVRDALDVKWRVRLSLARCGALPELVEAIRRDSRAPGPPILLAGDRAYLCQPGFGAGRPLLPDACYEVTGNAAYRLERGVLTSSVRWRGGSVLTVVVRAPLVGADTLDPDALRVAVGRLAGKDVPRARRLDEPPRIEPVERVVREPAPDGTGTDLLVGVPVRPLVEAGAGRYAVQLHADVAGAAYEVPVPMAGSVPQLRHWHRGRPYRVSAIADRKGRLTIAIARIRPLRVVGLRLRRLPSALGRRRASR